MTESLSRTKLAALRDHFLSEGYCSIDRVLELESVAQVLTAVEAVLAGRYSSGVAPYVRFWNPGDNEDEIRKINSPHLCDRVIHDFVQSRQIARIAHALTDAKMIQIWEVQLLYKPPGSGAGGCVGWHQDSAYWKKYWQGELLTAWIALSDVETDSAPLRFVPGSHSWGLCGESDFFSTEPDQQRAAIPVPVGQDWCEVEVPLHAGGISFHHPLVFHGSGENRSTVPRVSLAVHMRTDKAKPRIEHYYTSNLANPDICPVIYPVGTLI